MLLSGDRLGRAPTESRRDDPSIMRLRSLTVGVCMDCMRLCGLPRGTRARSGEGSFMVMRFAMAGTRAFSRAFSFRAACADCIAAEVPTREVPMPTVGDWGCSGRGGGARSGSELSHLVVVSEEGGGMVGGDGDGDGGREGHTIRTLG